MRTCGLANYITAILPLRKAKSEGHIDVDCCWSSIAQEEETLRRKIDLTSRGNRLVFKVIVSNKELPLVGAGRTSWQGSNCTEGINRFRESRSVCDWQLLRAKAIPRPLPTRKTSRPVRYGGDYCRCQLICHQSGSGKLLFSFLLIPSAAVV